MKPLALIVFLSLIAHADHDESPRFAGNKTGTVPVLRQDGEQKVTVAGKQVACPSSTSTSSFVLSLNGYLNQKNIMMNWDVQGEKSLLGYQDMLLKFSTSDRRMSNGSKPQLYVQEFAPKELALYLHQLSGSRSAPVFHRKSGDAYVDAEISTATPFPEFESKLGGVAESLKAGNVRVTPNRSNLTDVQVCSSDFKNAYISSNGSKLDKAPQCLAGNQLEIHGITYTPQEVAEALLPLMKSFVESSVTEIAPSILEAFSLIDACKSAEEAAKKKAAGDKALAAQKAYENQREEYRKKQEEKEANEKPYWDAVAHGLEQAGFNPQAIEAAVKAGKSSITLREEATTPLSSHKFDIGKPATGLSEKEVAEKAKPGETVAILMKGERGFELAVGKVKKTDIGPYSKTIEFETYLGRTAQILSKANGVSAYSGPQGKMGFGDGKSRYAPAIYQIVPLEELPTK